MLQPGKAPVPKRMRATSKGVCMYDLPSKFNIDITNSSFNTRVPQPKAIPAVAPLFSGLHDTDQFSLDRIFYDRMQQEATSWLQPDACKLFYIPYFSHWETSHEGKWVEVSRAPLDLEVLSHLTHMGQFRKPSGVDHFLTLSRVERDCRVLLTNPKFKHVKKLAIEGLAGDHGDPFLYAVPYPAWFRYSKALEPVASRTRPTVVVTSANVVGHSLGCLGLSAVDSLGQVCKGKPWCAFHAPAQIKDCQVDEIHGKYRCSDSKKTVPL